MALRLSFDTGALAGIHIVTGAKTIRLGRDPAHNDILLTNPKVSRRHAILERSVRGGYSMEVIGTGPSKLNGDAVQMVAGRSTTLALSTGDRLDLGGVEFTVAEAEVKLICVSGPAVGRDIRLDGPATIGSAGDNDLVINAPGVIERHLEIDSTPLGFKCDARSRTSFNGVAAESRMLAHGDEIVIGDVILRVNVTVSGEAADDDLESMTTMGSAAPATIILSKDFTAVGELVFIAGSAKNERIPLSDKQIIIGTQRLEDPGVISIVISDLLAAAQHCFVTKDGDKFFCTPFPSESGTYVNGERISKGTELKPNDLIAIGSHVLEARLIGGVKMEKKGLTTFTMMGDASALMGPQPKFVIDGRVVKAKKIIVGRAPTCDVIVDGAATSREHCTVEYSSTTGTFEVRDTSSHGTYLDDKRVVKQPLAQSCVLRAGGSLFRVTVRGETCTLERTDAALAEAAVEVLREQAKMTMAAAMPGGMAGARGPAIVGGIEMKTMFALNVGQLEQQIFKKKDQLKRKAPAWRSSSDLDRDAARSGAIILSLLAAIALCGTVVALGRGSALVNHPLSAAHQSDAFKDQLGGVTVCAGCHTAGARTDQALCINCHKADGAKTFEPRDLHKNPPAGHSGPGANCGSCHQEHTGAPEGSFLGATATCGDVKCHAEDDGSPRHQKAFAVAAPKGEVKPTAKAADRFQIVKLATDWKAARAAADKAPGTVALFDSPKKGSPAAQILDLHSTHAAALVNCNGCHAKDDGKGGVAEFATPELSCNRCHGGGAAVAAAGDAAAPASGCITCHGQEHTASPPPTAATATVGPADGGSPLTSVAWAGGFAFAGGLPVLLFGVVMRGRRRAKAKAMVERFRAQPSEVVKRLIHSINDSKCVGCGMCVQACPASVLELVEHKSRVVNFDSCIQCKRCEKACAFDALRMHDADKPPPMIPMPSLDAFHESPVGGLYLIGQASGTPQVKNATNLGRAIPQRIRQQEYAPGAGRAAGAEYDVIIVGSGPAGLSAALTCVELGFSYVVLEKERQLSWTIRNYYHKGKEVMAEPNDIDVEATLPHWDSKREELLGAWEELCTQNRVDIRYQQNVVDVKKDGNKFVVSMGDGKGKVTGQMTAGRIILAIGTLGNPRTLGCPGDDLEKVKNSLVDPDEWNGKNILVVGGSDSAVEVVMALCKPEKNNKVWFSTRGAKLEGIKPKNLSLILGALEEKKYEIRYATAVAEVKASSVVLEYKEDKRKEELPCDVIFGMIGGNSPQKWLQGLGIPYVDKPHSWSPPRTDHLALKTAEGLQLRRIPRKPIPKREPHH